MDDRNERQVSRQKLEGLKARISGAQERGDRREIDVEIFRLLRDEKVFVTEADSVTRWSDNIKLSGREFAYEVGGPAQLEVANVADGLLEIFPPLATRWAVPFYLENTDDALDLSCIRSLGRTISCQSGWNEDGHSWRVAFMRDGVVVASGCDPWLSTAIVLAVIDDLLSNADASYWVKVAG
ncbi:MAG: hypothetical protein Q7J28_03100 [Caulobacter sp.]|nr:hypothetical protein [Caulobacter sp.]